MEQGDIIPQEVRTYAGIGVSFEPHRQKVVGFNCLLRRKSVLLHLTTEVGTAGRWRR